MGKMTTAAALAALAAGLVALGPAARAIRADATTIETLQIRSLEVQEELEGIQAAADAEDRDLTDDEQTRITELLAEGQKIDADIERREQIADRADRLGKTLGRRSQPEDPDDFDPDNPDVRARADDLADRRVAARARPLGESDRWGWQNFGQFANAVRRAANQANRFVDPRLVQNAPTTFGTEGVGEDGGFAVPPEFRREIKEKVMGEDSLISRTDGLTTSGNSLTIPTDETTPWQSSGGIQAFWEGEGNQLTQSKPQLKEVTMRLNKLTALVPVTEELLADAPALDSYLRRKTPEKMDFKITNAIVDGSGAGQPLGVLNADSLVTVAKEGGQAADTILFENISKMYSRMYAPWRRNAVWLINQDIEEQLDALNHPGDSRPVFMPPGGLRDAPFGTIKGRPVIPTEAAKTLGDKGDIIFVDLNQYMTIEKTAGIRAETSIHLWFDFDTTAFRFIFRLAGQPWWKAVIDRFNGTNTLSWAVALAERA